MATIGVKVELEGTKEFNQGMKNLKEQTKLFDTQLKNLDQTMKGQSAFSKSIKEHELLTQKMEALSKESELLQQRIEEASNKFGENDSKTLALKNQYEKLQGEIAKTNEALQQNSGVFSAIGAELDELGGKLTNVGDKITGVGENLTKNITGPITALGAASVAAFNEVDAGMDTIVKKTGASGEALEEMKGIAEDIATSMPTSFDKVGEAVGEVNTRFGSTGDELQTLSTQFLKFSELNNTDVSSSIDTVQKALSAYGLGAQDAAAYLDRLNLVGQQTGVSVDSISNGIISNATAFQELGLSIDEAVTFMGDLEKSGANSETVLNGMRKALKNAAKEGKPLDKALSELQDTIENGTDGMDGLTAAYELFGKSGDQIYGAVKNGTVDFKKLAGTLEDAGGSITNTFEATQDPIDQFKTNLNKLKIAGTNLVQAANPMITQFFDKLSGAIDSLTAKWNSLSSEQQEQIVQIGLMVAAIGPLLVVVGKVISAVGSIFTGVSGLVGFIVANPVLAGITVALGLVTVAALALKEATDDVSDSVELQAQKLDQAKTAAENYNNQMDRFVQNNQSVVDGIDMQYKAEQDLVRELQTIVDENGNVKQGYEERAQVITNQLGEAFGIEIEMQGNVIQNYQETLGLIDEVINKKKAEALISAGQQEYINALQEQKTKYEELKSAEENLAGVTSEYNGLVDEATAAYKRYEEQLALGNYEAASDAYTNFEMLTAQAELQKEAVDAATESYQLYADGFYKNQAVIENYDNLQRAVAEGTTNLDSAITQFTQNLVNDAPIDYLRTQAEDAKTYYEELLADFQSGEVAISQSQLEAAKSNAEEAQKILTEAIADYRSQGLAAGAGYAEGMKESNETVLSAAGDIVKNALAKVALIQQTGSPAEKYIEQGRFAGEGYALGLNESAEIIQLAFDNLKAMLGDFQLDTDQTINDGLLANEIAVETSMKNIINGLDIDFEDISTRHLNLMNNINEETTTSFETLSTTVSEKMEEISEDISSKCDDIEAEFVYLKDNAYDWGHDFMQNFEDGIISKMQDILDRVKAMAEEIASYMHFTTPDKGPLKDADTWMPDFMKLLAQGIDSNRYLIDNAVKGVSADMASVLSSPFDVDELYQSVRSGASDAVLNIYLNDREVTRSLKGMGVQFNG